MSEYDEAAVGWEAQAKTKKLPEQFVQQLASSDAVTEAEKARIVASVATADELKTKRDAAVDYGRRLGTHEADRRREVGHDREQRIRRAMAYAAWEFDGKPLSSKPHREEFSVNDPDVTPSLERVLNSVVKKEWT